jgi:hypothetical protein
VGEETVKKAPVVDFNINAEVKVCKNASDHQENLEIGGWAVAAYNVKIALGEFTVTPPLGVLPAPHLAYMVALERKVKLLLMKGCEACKGNGKIKTERDITLAVIRKAVDLLLCLTAALAQKYFRVLKSGGINGHKPE